jgi:hypothetical protein
MAGGQEFDRCEAPPFLRGLALMPRCSLRSFRSPPQFPSVASVTSVRCLPLCVVLASDAKVFLRNFRAPPQSPQVELNLIFQLDPEKASFDEEREPRCRGL